MKLETCNFIVIYFAVYTASSSSPCEYSVTGRPVAASYGELVKVNNESVCSKLTQIAPCRVTHLLLLIGRCMYISNHTLDRFSKFTPRRRKTGMISGGYKVITANFITTRGVSNTIRMEKGKRRKK